MKVVMRMRRIRKKCWFREKRRRRREVRMQKYL
jgi:hypothetical protein